ncbi:sugar transferase [Zobellia amurskyensis]|uniref:Sugar transferase n=1 Tax=Zobellia amurskyensis TaxID=248905 RepID=A0A7X2ZXB1_9FLAO|nr:sugar transferase [Zobellia amurskyensis]MUH38096.1 sugar transferase [Zobellia amurskyensis]
MIAPICLFTYNRLKETQYTIKALQKNFLAEESDLLIFSDGFKNENAKEKVLAVRKYLKSVDGFKSVQIIESPVNKGLGESILDGVTDVVNRYGKAIVLEDDLSTTPNFLDYMNQALNFYENHPKIISICGYGLKIKQPEDYASDFYIYGRSSSWGWATWKNQWETIDWEIKDWKEFKLDKKAIRAFNYNGSDMFQMLKSVVEGGENTWAIRFGYSQFKQDKYSLTPFESFIENIGFGTEGTNTKHKFSRFKTKMNTGQTRVFKFDRNITVDKRIEQACYKYHSIPIRIYSRVRYILGV